MVVADAKPVFTCRLPVWLIERIAEIAAEEGTSKNEVVERTLEAGLDDGIPTVEHPPSEPEVIQPRLERPCDP